MRLYLPQKDGEWVQPKRKGYRFACCDCGLIHRFEFRVHDGKIEFRAWRHNRATATYRRHHGITIKYIAGLKPGASRVS